MNAAIAGFTAAAVIALVFAMKTDPRGPVATWAFRVVFAASIIGVVVGVALRI